MPLLRAPEADLFYVEAGKGTPLVVLHGGLGVDHTYMRDLSRLADCARVVLLDLRGNGRSSRVDPDSLTFDAFCADMETLREHLGAERISVLGHSFGGLVALDYALRHPDRVHRLLLHDTFASSGFWDEALEALASRDAALAKEFTTPFELKDHVFLAWLQRVMPLYFHRYDPVLARRAFAETVPSAQAWARGNELWEAYDATARLREVRAPTLVLHGRHDLIPVAQAELLRSGIPDAELAVFERSGHLPHVEEPEAFLGVVRSWLQRADGDGLVRLRR